jgi:hemolysin activation/secretion protein
LAAIVQVAPFFDIGRAWNRSRDEVSPRTLTSAGVGLILQPWPFLRGEVTWGHRFKHVRRPDGLQGEGVQFRVVLRWP